MPRNILKRGRLLRQGPPILVDGDELWPNGFHFENSAEGGTNGVAATAGNSGGLSGRPFDSVTVSGSTTVKYAANPATPIERLVYRVDMQSAATGIMEWNSMGVQRRLFVRVYFWVELFPASNSLRFITWKDSVGAFAHVELTSTGGLVLRDAAVGIIGTFNETIDLNRWYRVEAVFDTALANPMATAQFFSSPDALIPTQTISGGTPPVTAGPTSARFGQTNNLGNPCTINLDNIGLTNQGWLGPLGSAPGKWLWTPQPKGPRSIRGPRMGPRILVKQYPAEAAVSVVASPVTVAAVAAVPAPSVQADAIATPTTVAAVAAVPAPSPQANAIVATTTVVATSAVPVPTIIATTDIAAPQNIQPARRPGASLIGPHIGPRILRTQQPAEGALSIGVFPSTVAALAAVPAPTVQANAIATPVTVAAVVAVPAPAPQADAIVSTATVAVVAAVPVPYVQGTKTPQVITPARLPGPRLRGPRMGPPVLVRQRPAEGATDVGAYPNTVVAIAQVPAPTVQSNAVASPAAVAAVAAVPAPSVAADAIASPATVVVTVTVFAPAIVLGADTPNITPARLPGPSLRGPKIGPPILVRQRADVTTVINATALPATVAAVAAVPSPTVAGTAIATPAQAAIVAAVPAPTVSGTGVATPTQVVAAASVPSPSPLAAAIASPVTVVAIALVPSPSTAGTALTSPATVVVIALVPAPTVRGAVFVTPNVVVVIVAVPQPSIQVTSAIPEAVVPGTVGSYIYEGVVHDYVSVTNADVYRELI